MSKNSIKVIKRSKSSAGEKMPISSQVHHQPAKAQIPDDREMENVVTSWIAERGENRRTEEIAASSSLLDWKTLTADSETIQPDD